MPRSPAKAHEIALHLRDEIRAGKYRPGSWLPSERELGERHSAGRSAVRHALRLLDEWNLITLVAGRGAQVPMPVLDADELLRDGHSITVTYTADQGGRVKAAAHNEDGAIVAAGEGSTYVQAMASMTPVEASRIDRHGTAGSSKVSS